MMLVFGELFALSTASLLLNIAQIVLLVLVVGALRRREALIRTLQRTVTELRSLITVERKRLEKDSGDEC